MALRRHERTRWSGRKGGSAEDTPPPPPPTPPTEPELTPGAYVPQPPPERESTRQSRSSGGRTAGIVLIVIGLVFLIAQVVPGLAWWSMWPLIIVIAGVVQAFTPGKEGWSVARLFDGFVTVTIGLVLFAITTGVVGWSVFWTLLTLWPVLLIAIGLDILGKALHTSWIRALGSLCVIGAFAWAVSVSVNGGVLASPFWFSSADETVAEATIEEPVDGVEVANLKLDAGAARVTLDGGTDLVKAEGSSPWSQPEFSVDRSGSSADVRLDLGGSGDVVVVPNNNDARLDASVARDVVWDMDVTTGVSQFDADLSDVAVRSIVFKPGVADCTLRLGVVPDSVDESSAEIKAGVSTVRVRLPKNAEARIESDSGLTSHQISGDFNSVDDGWETEGFKSARNAGDGVWLITVKSGIGSIQVDTY